MRLVVLMPFQFRVRPEGLPVCGIPTHDTGLAEVLISNACHEPRSSRVPSPTNKEAGYHPATTQLPPATAWLPPATMGNRGVANPRYL